MWPFLFCNFFIDLLFQASGKIGDLISALDRFEPRSSYLYYHMAQIFSRIVSWYINFDKYNYIWFCNITMHRVLYQYVSRWSQRPLIVKPILDSVLALSLYKVTSIILQSVFLKKKKALNLLLALLTTWSVKITYYVTNSLFIGMLNKNC